MNQGEPVALILSNVLMRALNANIYTMAKPGGFLVVFGEGLPPSNSSPIKHTQDIMRALLEILK